MAHPRNLRRSLPRLCQRVVQEINQERGQQLASPHVGDDEMKHQQHFHNYEAREGICLDAAKIQKNPGLHALAKVMLNSMWGKFGQCPSKTRVKELDDPVDFHKFHKSNQSDIWYISVLTEERVEILYKHQREDNPVSPNLNICLSLVSPLVGPISACTRLSISCKSTSPLCHRQHHFHPSPWASRSSSR